MRNQALRISWRLLQKHPLFTGIKVIGLAFGLATVLLIGLYIQGESGYDRETPAPEEVFRVTGALQAGEESFEGPLVSPTLASYAKENWPEVSEAVRVFAHRERLIGVEGKVHQSVPHTLFADPAIFQLFGWEMKEGNLQTALEPKEGVVLSAELAQSLFPGESALGKKIMINQHMARTVTGVMNPLPAKLHLRPEALLSMNDIGYANSESWFNYNFYTYLRLHPGTKPSALDAKFRDLVVEKFDPIVKEIYGQDLEEYEAAGNYFKYGLQSLLGIHLDSHYAYELGNNVSRDRLTMFGLIGLLILLIASINFINLSTARSLNRAREVGVRKVMGAQRRELMRQFLTESIVLSLVATVLAIFIAELATPLFNALVQKQLALPLNKPGFWGILIIGGIGIGTLAGLYPAAYLSGFQPIGMLSGWKGNSKKGGQLRRPLVVVQFAISSALIMGSLVVYQQTNFLQNKDLGFSPDQVVVLENVNMLGKQASVLASELKELPGVETMSHTGYLPVNGIQNNKIHWPEGAQGGIKTTNLEFWEVDTGFVETFGLKLLAGRNFSALTQDSAAIILNPQAAKALGFGDDPIGHRVETYHPSGSGLITYEVVGLMEPVHFEGFEFQIGPMAMIRGSGGSYVSLKVDGQAWPTLQSQIEATWAEFAPFLPIQYQFMDARFARYWEQARGLGQLLLALTVLAIVIACLGLFALAAYMAEQRRSEIGLRKVLGASPWQIVQLLSTAFLKLVGIALVIAIPASWLLLGDWLNAYAYRIDLWEIAPGLILLVGGLSVGIALATISVQAIRASRLNPVEVLRDK